MSYKITNASGETAVISDEQYNRIKDRLNASTKVERVTEKSKPNPHQERQQKYGTLGSMFPYITDDYEKNGDVNSVGGAVRRSIAGIKDVASYPGRAIAGGLDYIVNGDNSLGKTSEEAMSKGQTTGGILRNPLTPLAFVPGIAPATIGQSVATGAAFGAADAGISQPYEGETTGERALNIANGAGIGAGFGLAPMAVPLFKAIQGKLKGLLSAPATKETLRQARELGNIIFRGKRSGQLSDYETDQLIKSQQDVFDKIARNMDRESLEAIRNESEGELLRNFGGIKIADDAEKGIVGRNDYVTRARMAKEPTAEERLLNDEISGVKKSIEQAKQEGNPGVIAEDSERLTQLKENAANAKLGRNTSYSEGTEQLVQAPSDRGQHAFTDKTTEKFFSNLNQTMDDAVTKMAGTWKTEGGRIRRNARGQVIPGTPEQLGNRANDYINMLSNQVQARSRGINTGVGEAAPRITNEDVAVVLQEMGRNNEWEFMDALLDACTWLSKTEKQNLKYNAILNKASVNALDALGVTPVSAIEQAGGVADVAGKIPKVGKYIKGIAELGNESKKGWPKDFSSRYEAMQRGKPYSVDFLGAETEAVPYTIPGIVITNGATNGGKKR